MLQNFSETTWNTTRLERRHDFRYSVPGHAPALLARYPGEREPDRQPTYNMAVSPFSVTRRAQLLTYCEEHGVEVLSARGSCSARVDSESCAGCLTESLGCFREMRTELVCVLTLRLGSGTNVVVSLA